MGGLGGLTGPAPTLWCALRGWDKDAQRAVFQSFNLVMHALTLAVYATSGLVTTEALGMFVVIAPAMVIPALIGAPLCKGQRRGVPAAHPRSSADLRNRPARLVAAEADRVTRP